MKILFCTNAFKNVTNGPAKFANLILNINEIYSDVDIRVLTEDIEQTKENVYKLELRHPKYLSKFSHLYRIKQYHEEAIRLRKEYPWDVLVYNNAFIGYKSFKEINNVVGMINDYTLATAKLKPNYYDLRNYILKTAEKKTIRNASLILSNSQYLKNLLEKTYKIDNKEKIKVLYKGVRIPEKTIINKNFNEEIRILFVKKNYFLGGLIYLLKAIKELPYKIHLNIIGPKKSELSSDVQYEIQQSPHRINVCGPKSQKEVFYTMQESHIFCVPSIQESLGVANIEALAHGCSVISTNIAGIPEVLDNGKAGWLAPPKNPSALAEAIEECINNEELRLQKKKHALNYIQKFDINNTIDNFVKILNTFIHKNNETNHPKP